VTRLTSTDRVRRMLAIVPWVAAQPDGVPIAEICERFDVDRDQLMRDLSAVSFVGVAPYTPDLLVEVLIEDDRVWVTLPVAFDRPLQLTPDEGLALLAAGASLLTVPGAEPDGPLARALERIADLLGVEPGDNLHIDLGRAEQATMDVLRHAIDEERQVQLDYYSYGRDEHAVRVVDPYRLWADSGQWYLSGHCQLARDERVFRVDRIESATLLDTVVEVPPPATDGDDRRAFRPGEQTPRIVLDLRPDARWVLEQYPLEAVEERPDGTVRVTLAVGATAWLERLLLRLGPDATVVEADAGLADAGREAARRVLARYR
jgi:proteasome accessory factor C